MPFQIYEHLVVGPLLCNCYIAGDPESRQAIVIDPGDNPDQILQAVTRHGLQITALVATHAHFDHVLAGDALRVATGAPMYLHASDTPLLETMQERGRMYLGIELPPPPEIDRHFSDGDVIGAGSLEVSVIHTPGHSPGSVSLLVSDEAVFSGDTLFAGSIGRTDLPGGDHEAELSSIRRRLFPLGDLVVFPGHGPETTIGREQAENPFLAS